MRVAAGPPVAGHRDDGIVELLGELQQILRGVATVEHVGVGVDAVLGEYGGGRLDRLSFDRLIAGHR
jgi:hypothetical protein